MSAHPIILDANGDQIADLFTTTKTSDTTERVIYLFSSNRSEVPTAVNLDSEASSSESETLMPLRVPHSNAFVDLNTDGNADLFVTGESAFELWEDVGGRKESHFKLHKSISYPHCDAAKVISKLQDNLEAF